MRTPRVAAAATLLTLATVLAACGGDDKDSDSDEQVTETVTASESASASASETTSSTTAPPTSVTPMDPTGDITLEQVNAALLTPAEVSPDFVLGDWTNEDSPPPCEPTGTPVDVTIPPSVEGGVEMGTSDGQIAMSEEIAIYESEDLASEAFSLGSAGLDCTTATLPDGTTATISAPEDVSSQVNANGIGTSTAWQVTGDGYEVLLVATLSGRIVLACTFSSATDADTSALPNPVDVATAAFAKALAN